MIINKGIRRLGTVAVAGVAAMAVASPAMAHHCYKEQWTEAAHAQVASGTAWSSMSDFVGFAINAFLAEELGLDDDCAQYADEFTAAWMDSHDVDQEPLIHMRATAGGGAAHQGKDVRPYAYLSDADFGELVGYILAEPDCLPAS